MAHFYNCTKIKQPFLEKEITTPSQAKKHKDKIFPSITTLIGSTIKDPFLDSVHKPRSMVKYARMEEYADLDWKDIEQLAMDLLSHLMGA